MMKGIREPWEGRTVVNNYGAEKGVQIARRHEDGSISVARLTFEKLPEGSFPGSTVEANPELIEGVLLAFVDAAAQLGFVPARNKDQAGELSAVRDHLKREQGTLDRLLTLVEKGAA